MRVRFLDEAKEDLREINQHYRDEGGPALAKRMLARIKAHLLKLPLNPFLYESYELAPDVRRIVTAKGAYLVFYRVKEYIEVIHIRRSERLPVTAAALSTKR